MAVFVDHHGVRLLPHLDVGHLHVSVEVDDLNGVVAFMRIGVIDDIINRPVAHIQVVADLHHLLGGVAHCDGARVCHRLRVDNPQVGTHQVGDVCLVGSHKVHLAWREEAAHLIGFRGVANYRIGIHLIDVVAVVDHDVELAIHQRHAFSHIAERGVVHLIKQVVDHRVGLDVVKRQRGVGKLEVALVEHKHARTYRHPAWVDGWVRLAGEQRRSQCQQQIQMMSFHVKNKLLFHNTFRNRIIIAMDAEEIDAFLQRTHVDDGILRDHNLLSDDVIHLNRLEVSAFT